MRFTILEPRLSLDPSCNAAIALIAAVRDLLSMHKTRDLRSKCVRGERGSSRFGASDEFGRTMMKSHRRLGNAGRNDKAQSENHPRADRARSAPTSSAIGRFALSVMASSG